jgi:hypothetical protein
MLRVVKKLHYVKMIVGAEHEMRLCSSTHSLDMLNCNNAHSAPRGQRNGSRYFSETCYRFWLRNTGFSRSIRGRIGPDCSEMSARQPTLGRCQIQVCGRCHSGAVENTMPVPKRSQRLSSCGMFFRKWEFQMRKRRECTKGCI